MAIDILVLSWHREPATQRIIRSAREAGLKDAPTICTRRKSRDQRCRMGDSPRRFNLRRWLSANMRWYIRAGQRQRSECTTDERKTSDIQSGERDNSAHKKAVDDLYPPPATLLDKAAKEQARGHFSIDDTEKEIGSLPGNPCQVFSCPSSVSRMATCSPSASPLPRTLFASCCTSLELSLICARLLSISSLMALC